MADPFSLAMLGIGAFNAFTGNKSSGEVSREPGSFVSPDAEGVSNETWRILNSPEFKNLLQGEAGARRDAGFGFINRTDESLGGYIDVLRRMQGFENQNQLTGRVGGRNVPILPKSVSRISDRGIAKGQDIFGKTLGQETARAQVLSENTPGRGFLEYFNRIQEAARIENARRSGLPTESAELDEPFDLAGIIKGLTPLYEQYAGRTPLNLSETPVVPEFRASF